MMRLMAGRQQARVHDAFDALSLTAMRERGRESPGRA
jgi:hypothetical protein